jgi:hypothetical protein
MDRDILERNGVHREREGEDEENAAWSKRHAEEAGVEEEHMCRTELVV